MKHATPEALDRLEALLADIRRLAWLKEKTRGVFYCRSRATLHFHEDPKGLFADFRTTGDWERFPVNTKIERAMLLTALEIAFAAASAPRR